MTKIEQKSRKILKEQFVKKVVLKHLAKEKVVFMDKLRKKIEYKKKHRVGTEPVRSTFSYGYYYDSKMI